MTVTPKCPWCKTAAQVYEHGDREFWCRRCNRIFDGIDDGDVGYGGPSRRMEREERRQQRTKARAAR